MRRGHRSFVEDLAIRGWLAVKTFGIDAGAPPFFTNLSHRDWRFTRLSVSGFPVRTRFVASRTDAIRIGCVGA